MSDYSSENIKDIYIDGTLSQCTGVLYVPQKCTRY